MLLGQAAPARPAAGLSRGAGASPTGGRRRGLPKDVGAASLPRWTVSNDATRPKPARSPDERPSAPAPVMIGVHAGSEMTRTGRRFLPPLPLLRLLSPAAPRLQDRASTTSPRRCGRWPRPAQAPSAPVCIVARRAAWWRRVTLALDAGHKDTVVSRPRLRGPTPPHPTRMPWAVRRSHNQAEQETGWAP